MGSDDTRSDWWLVHESYYVRQLYPLTMLGCTIGIAITLTTFGCTIGMVECRAGRSTLSIHRVGLYDWHCSNTYYVRLYHRYFTHLIGLTQAPGLSGAGYKSIRVAPRVPSDLAGAALQLQTDGGTIHVQWSQGNATTVRYVTGHPDTAQSVSARFALSVTVPVSTDATLCIPTFGQATNTLHIVEGNKSAWVRGHFVDGNMPGCNGAVSATAPGGGLEICFACGCGKYHLVLLESTDGN